MVQVTFSKKHLLENWGTKFTNPSDAKSETACAIFCSSNDTCSSYLYKEGNDGKHRMLF